MPGGHAATAVASIAPAKILVSYYWTEEEFNDTRKVH